MYNSLCCAEKRLLDVRYRKTKEKIYNAKVEDERNKETVHHIQCSSVPEQISPGKHHMHKSCYDRFMRILRIKTLQDSPSMTAQLYLR